MSDTLEPIPVPDIPILPSEQTKYKITRPVNVKSVYQFFGIAPYRGAYDIAYLCSNQHGKINPASKIKPIQSKTPKSLAANPLAPDPEDFVGTDQDHNEGYYYGIKCRLTAASGKLEWDDLHRCNWSYRPPVPGTHYARLDDFNGYNHRAEFNPHGSILGTQFPHTVTIYYDEPVNWSCGISIQTVGSQFQDGTITTNQNGQTINPDYVGVNLQDVIKATSQTIDIGTWYPCIAISNATDDGQPAGGCMVRALAANNNTDSLKRYQPLRNSSAAWGASYTAEVYHELNGDIVDTSTGLTWPNKPCKKIASLFIVNNLGSSVAGFNLRKWTSVDRNTGVILPLSNIFSIPLATGIIVNYRRKNAQGLELDAVFGYVSGFKLRLNFSFAWVNIPPDNIPARDVNYLVRVSVYQKMSDGSMDPAGGGGITVPGADFYGTSEITSMKQIIIDTNVVDSGIIGSWSVTFSYSWTIYRDTVNSNRIVNSGGGEYTYTSN